MLKERERERAREGALPLPSPLRLRAPRQAGRQAGGGARGQKKTSSQPTCARSHCFFFFFVLALPPSFSPSLYLLLQTPLPCCSGCCETNKSRAAPGWGLHACGGGGGGVEDYCAGKKNKGGREAWKAVGGAAALQPSRHWADGGGSWLRGGCFGPEQPANGRRGPAPWAEAGLK